MSRNLLLSVLFIIIFLWAFKVFERKVNTRNYTSKVNSKSEYFKAAIDGISDTSNETIWVFSSECPCNSKVSNETQFNFELKTEIYNISSDKLKDEISNASNIVPKSSKEQQDTTETLVGIDFHFNKSNLEAIIVLNLSSNNLKDGITATSNLAFTSPKELSRAPEKTPESFVNFDDHYLDRKNTSLHSNDTNSERIFDFVKEYNRPAASLKELAIVEASNDSRRTDDDILDLEITTGGIDELVTAKYPNKVSLENRTSNGNALTKPTMEKSDLINNQFPSNNSGAKGDDVEVLDYINELYDVVLESFVKLEEVHKLVNELKAEFVHIYAKYQNLSSNANETTRSLFETKCILRGNIEQNKTKFEKLEALKSKIDRGYLAVDEAMSDLAYRHTVYEELHQSGNKDGELFESARAEILKTIKTISLLMNNVQKDTNKFLKKFPDLQIVCD